MIKKLGYLILSILLPILSFGQGTQINSSPIYYGGSVVNIGGLSDASLRVRHLNGKHPTNTSFENLYLNYNTGYHVYVGFGGLQSNLLVDGKIGIGTTSPTKSLSVNGDIGLKNNGWITFKNSSGSNDDGIINYDNAHRLRLNYGAGGFLITKSATNVLFANDLGNVGIGTTNTNHKLEVNGTIRTKKVKVEINHWPDYVFSDNYKLLDIKALEAFIKTNKHLPEVPSAKEVETNGLDLGAIDATLLKKVEELTLYMIEMKKEIEALKKENKKLSDEVKKVRK